MCLHSALKKGSESGASSDCAGSPNTSKRMFPKGRSDDAADAEDADENKDSRRAEAIW